MKKPLSEINDGSSDSMPLVSVVVPAHNSARYIAETIDSVLRQTYGNFEIIVVDDSSEDDTVQEVVRMATSDNRIKLHRIEHAGRPSVPRNEGIRLARGQYTAFLDSDDLWTRHKLEDQIHYMLSDPEAVFVYSMSVTFGDVNLFSPSYEVLPLLKKAALSYEDLISKGNSVTCSSILIRTDILRSEGGFDEDPKLQIEDYDLWIRLSRRGKIGFIPRIHVFYRVHTVQFSGSWELKQQRLEYLSDKLKIQLPPYRFARNRSLAVRIARNALHFSNYIWALTAEFFQRNIFRKNRGSRNA